ncbi:MAG: Polyphenol oxidase [Dehalococcoidia bacterium]|nr:Polyphenol oxidase [Dehalococcoidia bacterium]
MEYVEVDDTRIATFSIFQSKQGVRHGVSTKVGALNMRNAQGSETTSSQSNRRRFLESLGLDYDAALWGRQVHGCEIAIITSRDHHRPPLQDTDGIVTNIPGLPIMVAAADCVPILLYDPYAEVVGAVHAGWRGTVQCIAQKAVQSMVKSFGSVPENILAGIGPSIGPCCYEVGEAVLEPLRETFPGWWPQLVVEKGGSRHMDLWSANRLQLLGCGVAEENIEEAQVCTSCSRRFQWPICGCHIPTLRYAI